MSAGGRPGDRPGMARGDMDGYCSPVHPTWDFHGTRLTVDAEAPVLAAIGSRLRHFPAAPTSDAAVRLVYRPVPDTAPPIVDRPDGPARVVMSLQDSEVLYFESSGQLYVDIPGRARMRWDPFRREVLVSYVPSAVEQAWYVSHPLFTIPLHVILKQQGRYMVHAATLAHEGHGLLVSGVSGAGKTTLALALVRAGWEFLGDDTVFVSAQGPDWIGHGFPDEVDITPQTAGFFPELAPWSRPLVPGERPKRAVCAAQVYGIQPRWDCQPRVLVFPQSIRTGETRLEPMAPSEALVGLMNNVLRTDRAGSQGHLDALAGLVRQCDCYRVWTGQDFGEIPGRMRELLRRREARAGLERGARTP